MTMTREQFEKNFEEISTWELGDMEFTPEEKELIRKVCMNELTMEQYDQLILRALRTA
jgi:hypothetical protein